ncbi:MAG: hypothetical protein A2287_08800 [Candidatus Melainabacteria bacterium RIFOXYA12_FULL_32_12]|nr:MAG: hypothetical protein A2104_08500 [Candidatus Melainabacteria bacterium GWF2_32_7]OGI20972.1 MAG: hypothetical protein A2255_07800 [Candidatus Melainabacteria bacterium RIFOXYA2_FULL_32_9]OGI24387.1 MAG: hypothetical protein A2287_08800 [Candidatus Melainabacteria bacterium RIFOXYA12_FULL_32_12]
MAFIIIKVLITALVIVLVTEIAKRHTSLGGLIAAMPITTLLSLFWLYYEKKDLALLSDFTRAIFWGIFPTLLFFIPAIFLFKKGWNFYLVLGISFICLGIGAYIHQKYVS